MPNETKPLISPGQGLLLLIDHYQKKGDEALVARLKTLYLAGARSEEEVKELKTLLTDSYLKDYAVSYSAKVISEDPTRRYFETHLAYETLIHSVDEIDLTELRQYVEQSKEMIPEDKRASVESILDGKVEEGMPTIEKEYADYLSKIKSGKIYPGLSAEDREKIELLVKSCYLAVANGRYRKLPLEAVYETGFYAGENRGKLPIQDQSTTRSRGLGLMKGHMPLPVGDRASSDHEIPYLKPSDQATFIETAPWNRYAFSHLVHPFSNSISGTMLCQLRVLAKIRNDGTPGFTASAEKMARLTKLIISAMLFYSGGHSLLEFCSPLSLPEVREEFSSTPGIEDISLVSMYLAGNEENFDAALNAAIEYNRQLLLRRALHSELECSVREIPASAEGTAAGRLRAIAGAGVAPTEAGVAPTEAGVAPTEAGVAPTEAGVAPTEAGSPKGSNRKGGMEKIDMKKQLKEIMRSGNAEDDENHIVLG